MDGSLLRFTMTGSVDDGKSTLIGRLLHDQKVVHEDTLDSVREASHGPLDFSLLTDGLRAEREQGITIDVAYRYFSSKKRRFIVADTPGHDQYTRNMVTGASTADVAVVLIDATRGILPQTRRHAYLSWMLGIRHLCIAINKMDAVSFDRNIFETIGAEFKLLLQKMPGAEITFIPVSALAGENVVHPGQSMPWYDGPTLIQFLENVQTGATASSQSLRLPVQTVIRRENNERSYAGRIAAGTVKVGDEVIILPSGRSAQVAAISAPDPGAESASSPMSASLTLDRHIDISRGDMIVAADHHPAVSRRFQATVFWMGTAPLAKGKTYSLKHTARRVQAEVTKILSRLDINQLEHRETLSIAANDVGRVEIETRLPIFCEPYTECRETGSFILIDPMDGQTVAAGTIDRIFTDRPRTLTAPTEGEGSVIWLTGLSSSGKTTIGEELFDRLRAAGRRVEMLDGDIVRTGLCKDLGFTKQDRDENIRRIGYVSEMLARHGVIVIVSAISPYRALRDEVRTQIPNFCEVFVNAPLSVCEHRDVKGLYRKARAGELRGFTGIDDPYEPPLQPEVECRTDLESVEQSVRSILAWLGIDVPA